MTAPVTQHVVDKYPMDPKYDGRFVRPLFFAATQRNKVGGRTMLTNTEPSTLPNHSSILPPSQVPPVDMSTAEELAVAEFNENAHALGAALTPENKKSLNKILNATVIVAALGYFVDVFDLTLYGVVRIPSLQALGISDPERMLEASVYLSNMGMFGMLLGGLLWGVMGDKLGRLSTLFGSILIYSLANIANAFVTSVPQYAWMRFIAGVGLAGELGAAITLVSEVMPKESRGWATTIIATMGLLGGVAAALFGQLLSWKTAYIIGGVMGLLLLAARFHTYESGMFNHVKHAGIRKGDILMLLSPKRLPKYLGCILIGVPIWFTTGILMTYAPELTHELGFTSPITAGNSLLFVGIGMTIGDILSGAASQLFKSRRKAVGLFLGTTALLVFAYSQARGISPVLFYTLCFAIGISAGYWAVFVTIAAEQFGTNIRATVATTVPNFVRASIVLVLLGFSALKSHLSIMYSALSIGAVCFALAFIALALLPETYGKDLDYLEE